MATTDLWLVHTTLPRGADRIPYSAIGVDDTDSAATVLAAAEKWWGGAWPAAAIGGGENLSAGDLTGWILEETARSEAGEKECIIHDPTQTLASAETKISDVKVNVP